MKDRAIVIKVEGLTTKQAGTIMSTAMYKVKQAEKDARVTCSIEDPGKRISQKKKGR